MNKVHVTFWPPNGTVIHSDVEFTSETGSLHFRIEPGVIEVKDGNVVLAAYANIPVVALNMDNDDGDA